MLLARSSAVVLAALNIWILVNVVWRASYPPVTGRLSGDVTRLTEGATYDLAAAPDGSYAVTGGDSQIAFGTSVPVADYPFLRFQISGTATTRDVVGAVYSRAGLAIGE